MQEDLISTLPEDKRREIKRRMNPVRSDLLYVVIGKFLTIA